MYRSSVRVCRGDNKLEESRLVLPVSAENRVQRHYAGCVPSARYPQRSPPFWA